MTLSPDTQTATTFSNSSGASFSTATKTCRGPRTLSLSSRHFYLGDVIFIPTRWVTVSTLAFNYWPSKKTGQFEFLPTLKNANNYLAWVRFDWNSSSLFVIVSNFDLFVKNTDFEAIQKWVSPSVSSILLDGIGSAL